MALNTASSDPRNRLSRRELTIDIVWVVIRTIVGACLRFWKLDYGLPHILFIDEGQKIYLALNMGGGDLNPHNFVQPSFFYYLLLLADVLYIAWNFMTGVFKELSEAWRLYTQDPTVYYWLARSVSAAFGTVTIPLTYIIGQRFFNRFVGGCAALFLAFSYIHAQYSQVGYIDITLTFFITFCFLLSVTAQETGHWRYFMLAGFVGGLSMSTKYSGLPTMILGPIASYTFALRNGKPVIREILGKKTMLFYLSALIGFTFGTPYWVLDFPKFSEDVLYFWGDYKLGGVGQLGAEGKWNWFYYLFNPLCYGLGLPLEITGIAGILWLALRRRLSVVLFVVFPLVYFFILGLSDIRTPRYIMPLIPFLCLGAAFFLDQTGARIARLKTKWGGLCLLSLVLVVVSPSAVNLLRYNYLKLQQDTRKLARDWVLENIKPEEKFIQTLYAFIGFSLAEILDHSVWNTRLQHASSLKTLDEYRQEGVRYLVLDDWHTGTVLTGVERNPKYQETGVRYRRFLKQLDSTAKLVAEFSPYSKPGDHFDPENLEFISRSLWKMKRLGPRIQIYKL